MNDLRLRAAEQNDANRVCEILIESRKVFLPYAPSAHTDLEMFVWVKRHLLPNTQVMLAIKDEQVVGVFASDKKGGISWVEQLYVDPAYVNDGVGALLLSDFLDNLSVKSSHIIRLISFQENTGARRFYERFGFQAIKLSDGFDNEERCPDVLYELKLNSLE